MLFAKAQQAVEANVKVLMSKKKKEHEEKLARAIARKEAQRGYLEVATTGAK
jgi:hypothetical protein